MKLTISRQPLLEAVGILNSVATEKAGREILRCLLLEAKQSDPGDGESAEGGAVSKLGSGSIELQATDLEVSIRRVIPDTDVTEEGMMALPAGPLQAILRETRSEQINLASDGRVLHLSSENGDFKLLGDDPEEFPTISRNDPTDYLELSGAALAEDLERAEIAAARDIGRYAVNGVLLSLEGQTLELVATDGRRLSHVKREFPGLKCQPTRSLAPIKGISLFRKTLAGGEELVGLCIDPAQVVLKTSHTEVMARAVEGEFPDYRQVISKDLPHRAMVATESFNQAVRQASIMAGDEARAVYVNFVADGLELTSEQEGRGAAQVRVPAEHDGEGVRVALNPDFLVEFARVPLPDSLAIQFPSGEGPVIFRPDERYLYLVMPVTTQ